jgi:hypothetical protein
VAGILLILARIKPATVRASDKKGTTMSDVTTTEAPVESGEVQQINGIAIDDQGMAISQPEETEQAEAVEETTETETEAVSATAEPSEEDEQLSKFAETKGLTLDSDNAKKAAKMAMNAEKAMHAKSQRASELERTMGQMSDTSAEQVAQATGENPEILKRIQRMEVKESINDFWDANPDAKQYESEMAQIAVDSGLFGSPDAILKASYAMAVANNSATIKSQGKREGLESLAQKQQAAVPRGNAVNTGVANETITPQNVDFLVGKNSMEWYMSHRDEINKAMAS